ncbi:ATP-dependent DNA helicase [Candidatus Woesearchaeota archaeon]|nr:ATP-dependent DNA helicase [Candidatus Woesearchaeota archaeon]
MLKPEEVLFPYEKIRKEQDKLISEISKVVTEGKNLVAHAPTGSGKTVAALCPALKFALENDKRIFFLTSRHTQHMIAIDTLKQIKEKYELDFSVADMIGKRWMCLMPLANDMRSTDFHDFCKAQVENDQCEFYLNFKIKSKVTVKAKKLLKDLNKTINHTEDVIKRSADQKICPYEISTLIAKGAKVIVADYFHIFNENVRNVFFTKLGVDLDDCIVIVDEAHNLPTRIRDFLSVNISNYILRQAVKEAKKHNFTDIVNELVQIQDILNDFSENVENERLIDKNIFINRINKIKDYDDLMEELERVSDFIKTKQSRSFVNSVHRFLEVWLGQDDGFARILSIKQGYREPLVILSYRCLDPSLAAQKVIEQCHSVICMSGTLTPTDMYSSILGFDGAEKKEFESVFPEENRLSLVIPETTTKFTMRNENQFRRIAEICSDIINRVDGNTLVYFPSYKLRDDVDKYLTKLSRKTLILEKPRLTKTEKSDLFEKFKKHKDKGSALLCAATGSFGEGIDLPGDLVKCVIVVGLPLSPPNLETKKLIDYYDKKFGKGWEYGYVFPAITKILQNAGRCIRSETDKGIIIFLDERFASPNYLRYFPKDFNVKVTKEYEKEIDEFLNKKFI